MMNNKLKVGDLVKHKRYGFYGIVLNIPTILYKYEYNSSRQIDVFIITKSDWDNHNPFTGCFENFIKIS